MKEFKPNTWYVDEKNRHTKFLRLDRDIFFGSEFIYNEHHTTSRLSNGTWISREYEIVRESTDNEIQKYLPDYKVTETLVFPI